MMSALQLAERLERAAERIDAEIAVPTLSLMAMVAVYAHNAIGTYEYGWRPLAESTKADRVAKGFPEDEPLLRTGQLAASIEYKAERSTAFGGAQGLVYSDDIIALYQEMGTRNIPPRSFLFGSLFRAVPEMEAIFGAFAVRVLTVAVKL